ncbi:MAG: hypothetical protein ACD_83C00257G0001 [uncultured bacterium]|nr:MAG: hypothetical protein ACD_83C00257G0001 [uncultured bacterium]
MKIFVDASFFVALAKKDDSCHQKAKEIINSISGVELYTAFYIIDEAATVLTIKTSKPEAVRFLNSIKQKDFPTILPFNKSDRLKAYDLFKESKINDISINDCISVIIMKKHGIKKCLSFDKHFKKLGFEIILN